jgi:CHAD domain-containing protein
MHVIKDVSFDEAYKNKNLVLDGKPDTVSKIESIFKELDTKTHDELDSYFIPNLSPIDALRVILYKYSLLILYYKERILNDDNIENLHQFRVNIRKSRAFLKEFDFLFPNKEYTYFYDTLSHFATQTNHKRDLDVIKERLQEVDRDHDIIQEDIAAQRKQEEQKIEEMLKSKMFENFFHTYQNALTKETLLTSYNTSGTIEDTARKVIEKLHLNIIKKIDDLEKGFSDKKLHKIRISLKKLRYLLEEFQHIFGEEKIEKMIAKGKKLQTLLGDFNDTVNQCNLLHNYFKSQKKSISNTKELEHRLLEKTSKSQEKLLLQTKKKLHKFKEKALKL